MKIKNFSIIYCSCIFSFYSPSFNALASQPSLVYISSKQIAKSLAEGLPITTDRIPKDLENYVEVLRSAYIHDQQKNVIFSFSKALHNAVIKRDKKLIDDILLDIQTNPAASDYIKKTPRLASYLMTYAVSTDNIALFQWLIDHGIRPTASSALLHIATQRGNIIMITKILESGANINEFDKYNKTPLFYAVDNGPLFNFLIEKGATIYIPDLLFEAVKTGNPIIVQKIITTKKIPINTPDFGGKTVLFYAVEQNNQPLVGLLIRNGADANAADYNERNALFYAIRNNNYPMVHLLRTYKAALQQKDIYGTSLIHEAARVGNRKIIRFLIQEGLDINAQDVAQQTPLHVAVESVNDNIPQSQKIVEYLISQGADVNAINIYGETPLDVAIKQNNPIIIKTLQSHGAIRGKTTKKQPNSCSVS